MPIKYPLHIFIMLLTLAFPGKQLAALGVQIGPFALQLDGGFALDRGTALDPMICNAIASQKLLEMIVEWREVEKSGDEKIITKKITVEPYLYGLDASGRPIIKGNIVSENVLKEVSIKYGEKKNGNGANGKDKSVFSAIFRSTGNGVATMNLDRVAEIRMIEQSHFNPPENYAEIFKGDVVQVICSIAPPAPAE